VIHYHGTPITDLAALYTLEVEHFCVSYANRDQVRHVEKIAQSIMFDNGAWSHFTKGKAPDWPGYYRWVEPRLRHPHWAVIPDVIDGGVDAQRKLEREWPLGDLGAPVWHMDEPFSRLLELADSWPRICFGSAGAYFQLGTAQWEARLDRAFAELGKRGLKPWVHMLRAMEFASKGRWPFGSTDSANVAVNHHTRKECAGCMAKRLNRVNPVPRVVGQVDFLEGAQ